MRTIPADIGQYCAGEDGPTLEYVKKKMQCGILRLDPKSLPGSCYLVTCNIKTILDLKHNLMWNAAWIWEEVLSTEHSGSLFRIRTWRPGYPRNSVLIGGFTATPALTWPQQIQRRLLVHKPYYWHQLRGVRNAQVLGFWSALHSSLQ